MKLHSIAIALALPLLSLVAAPSALSQVHVGIGVRIGPPAPVYEEVYAPPFARAVWIRGYWAWNPYAGRYMWTRGHWVAGRPAYHWVDGGWYHGPRGWYRSEGRWEHNGRGHEVREYARGEREGHHYGYDRHMGPDRGNGRWRD